MSTLKGEQMLGLCEADVQRACIEYLEAKRIMYLRLNSGDVFRPGAAGKMYKVKGCPKGTADLLILYNHKDKLPPSFPRPVFVEFKSSKGKQTAEQQEFEKEVKARGYEYYVVRYLEELIEVLK